MAEIVPNAGVNQAIIWNICQWDEIASDPHLQPAAKYHVTDSITHLYIQNVLNVTHLYKIKY